MGSDPPSEKTCATCRFAATDRRKQIIDATGFGDQMMFKDPEKVVAKDADGNEYVRVQENEIVYSCKAETGPHRGKVIGTVPIACDTWQPIQKATSEELSEMDRLIAARDARVKEREAKERK